ncbi:mucin-2 isoform X1 [Wyeomyia smithii]|uniref:mucin-2 isoform X1 n=1 Tax=Wyeomyia smithii TaxID=174621 RepID=UPI00246805DC|nr:mucin-2 isoform X1 [Wyeomyia smithii]
MSSQIPPLFCHTPPPMDFGDEDDEEDLPDPEEDDFDDFAAAPDANTISNLPTPVPSPFPESDKENSPIKKPPTQNQSEPTSGNPQSVIPEVTAGKEDDQVRIESPPSLILSQHVYSENDLPSEDEFQEFAYHSNEDDRKKTFATQESEDNISIPSLHLDTEVSKPETPVCLSENETSEQNLSPQETGVADIEQEQVVEAAITPVIPEDLCYRFDDNTENDFTDFTTASNERSAVLEVPTANDVSFDDDFAQLESTPSADSNFVSQSKTDFATFDADFSKFDSFPASFPATCGDDTVSNITKDTPARLGLAESEEQITSDAPNEDNVSQDDFDDFQGFTSFTTASSTSKPAETIVKEDIEEDSEDDFGDFSDFKQSKAMTMSTSVAADSRVTLFTPENIQSIISEMFPTVETQSHIGSQTTTGSELLQNKLFHELKDVDSTKALSYQYSSSESSKSLVQALGIDSRNILFGPKWNSSMPRFAANLSFSPLEPMKPTTSSLAPAIILGAGSSTTRQDMTAKYLTPGLDSSMQPPMSRSIGNVPAVQFDWNSSGLVNPLDASHAHTLLLDLEQLEVMVNLKDKINIDSSPSSCNANVVLTLPPSSITPLTSPITTATKSLPSTITTTTSIVVNNKRNNNNNTRYATNPNPDGGGFLLDEINLFCTNPPTPLKPMLVLPCAVATTNTTATVNADDATRCPVCRSTLSQPTTTITTTTSTAATAINSTTVHGGDGDATLAVSTGFTSPNNLQSFDDYLDLSVHEILQEGGTFQPNKNGPASEILDPKIPENASSSTSDEVVATSLGQEPELSIPEKSTTTVAHPSSVHDDGFAEYASNSNQLKSIPSTTTTMMTSTATTATIFASSTIAPHQPVTSSPLMASSGSVVRIMKLPETHIFTPSKCISPVSRDSTDRTDPYGEASVSIDSAVSKDIVVREYHDVEYSLEKISPKGQSLTDAGDDLDDFHEFQAVSTIKPEVADEQRVPDSRKTHLDVGSEFNFRDRREKQNTYSKPVFGTSPTEEIDQIDDEFSDFQAAVPADFGGVKTIVNKPITSIAGEQNRSNTSSPMLLSPSILLPQQSKPPEPVGMNQTTQINWPEPGIDPEELARFEAAFPKPKVANTAASSSAKHAPATTTNAADDEEWSDFVYSKPAVPEKSPKNSNMTTGTTKTANNQLLGEWTDFMGSAPVQRGLASSRNNFNYQNSLEGPKFSSWNQPQLPQPNFSSWNSNNFYYNPGSSHNDNNSSSNFTKPSVQNLTQKVPTFSPAHQAQPPRINPYYPAFALPAGANQSQRLGNSSTIPGISHLPALSFITPNAPAGTSKPVVNSFLSNSFTKK